MTRRNSIWLVWLLVFAMACTEESNEQPNLDINWQSDNVTDDDTGEQPDEDVVEETSGPSFEGEVGFKVIKDATPVAWNAVWGIEKGFGDFDLYVGGTLGTVSIYGSGNNKWETLALDSMASVNGIWAESRKFIVICGEDGLLKRYADVNNTGDLHWYNDDAATGVQETINDVHGSDQNNVWAVGNNGVILKLEGETWTKFDAATTGLSGNTLPDLLSVHVEDSGTVHIGGDGVYLTYDGATFTANAERFADFELFDIDVAADGVVWISADNHGIFHIETDGTTVEHAPTVYPASEFHGIWAAPQGHIYATGYLAPPIVWDFDGNEQDLWSSISVEPPPRIADLYPDRISPESRLSGIWGFDLENYVVITLSGQVVHYAAHP